MKNYVQKRNEKETKDSLIQRYLISKLLDSGITGKVDVYGNIKYTDPKNDRDYRYHIKNRVVTKEIHTLHEATQYSPASKSWTRLKSFSYKDLISVADVYFDSKE
jgi:hypothetical protein